MAALIIFGGIPLLGLLLVSWIYDDYDLLFLVTSPVWYPIAFLLRAIEKCFGIVKRILK